MSMYPWKLIENKTNKDGTGAYVEKHEETGEERLTLVAPKYHARKMILARGKEVLHKKLVGSSRIYNPDATL